MIVPCSMFNYSTAARSTSGAKGAVRRSWSVGLSFILLLCPGVRAQNPSAAGSQASPAASANTNRQEALRQALNTALTQDGQTNASAVKAPPVPGTNPAGAQPFT